MSKKTDYIELAIKYGGYMEMDRDFLQNRMSGMTKEQKFQLIVPSPQVINASFSELYQKRNPSEATKYFFGMSEAFSMFFDKPAFGLEGKKDYEIFRFIRLNIDGKSYGYSYLNQEEEAIIFSELSQPITQKFMLNLSRIFPQYVVFEENKEIHMRPFTFERFVNQREVTALTSAAENDSYLKFFGYNIDDLLEQAEQTFGSETLMQFDPHLNQFIIYQSKGEGVLF